MWRVGSRPQSVDRDDMHAVVAPVRDATDANEHRHDAWGLLPLCRQFTPESEHVRRAILDLVAPEGMESVGNRTKICESVCGTVMNRPQQGSS